MLRKYQQKYSIERDTLIDNDGEEEKEIAVERATIEKKVKFYLEMFRN